MVRAGSWEVELVPMLLLSYLTRLLGNPQPSSYALQALLGFMLGAVLAPFLLRHGQYCASNPAPLKMSNAGAEVKVTWSGAAYYLWPGGHISMEHWHCLFPTSSIQPQAP